MMGPNEDMIVDLIRPLKSECPTSAHIESNSFNFTILLLLLLILVIKLNQFIYLDLGFCKFSIIIP